MDECYGLRRLAERVALLAGVATDVGLSVEKRGGDVTRLGDDAVGVFVSLRRLGEGGTCERDVKLNAIHGVFKDSTIEFLFHVLL